MVLRGKFVALLTTNILMTRKVILSALGLALIVGALFFAKYLIDNKNKPKPVVPKVVKTVLVDTVENNSTYCNFSKWKSYSKATCGVVF